MNMVEKLTVLLCSALLFASCGTEGDKQQIKEVAESYIKAYASFSYAEMKVLVTPESAANVDKNEQMMKSLPEVAKQMAKEAATSDKLDAESIVVEGETAKALINQTGGSVPFTFKKVEGKWLVDLAEQ